MADLLLVEDKLVFQLDDMDNKINKDVYKKNLTYFNNYICIFLKNVYTKVDVRFLLTTNTKTNDRSGRKGCISHIRKNAYDDYFSNQTIQG